MIPISKLEIQQSVVIDALRAENAKLRGLLLNEFNATEELLNHGSPVPDSNGDPVPYQANLNDVTEYHENTRAALNQGEKL